MIRSKDTPLLYPYTFYLRFGNHYAAYLSKDLKKLNQKATSRELAELWHNLNLNSFLTYIHTCTRRSKQKWIQHRPKDYILSFRVRENATLISHTSKGEEGPDLFCPLFSYASDPDLLRNRSESFPPKKHTSNQYHLLLGTKLLIILY